MTDAPRLTSEGGPPEVSEELLDHADAVAAMDAKYGNLYSKGVIKAGSYPGQDKDNPNADVWNILVTDEKMPDDFAYAVVKMIFDKKAELVAVHREAENFLLDTQKKKNSPIPFHPGAIKYFKEKGLSF